MRIMWVCVVAALGCGKKDSGSESKPAEPAKAEPAKPAEAAKPVEPTKPGLSVDAVMGAKEIVKPFDPWDDGLAKLQAKLGPPTKVKDTTYYWAATQGDDCAELSVDKGDAKKLNFGTGFIIGSVTPPQTFGKANPSDECNWVVGKNQPPEDPNAKAPPTDGSAVTVGSLLDNASKARSKWEGQTIKLSGFVREPNKAGGKLIGVYLYDHSDTAKSQLVACSIDDDAPAIAEAKVAPDKAVTMQVMVDRIGDSGAGTRLYAKHCVLAP